VKAGSKISLCYDRDTVWNNGNETWIEVNQVAAANGNGSYTWNTTGVKPGSYYVAGYLSTNGKLTYSLLTQSIVIAAPVPLRVNASAAPKGSPQLINDRQLAPIVVEAERRLAAANGIQVLAAMAGIKVQVADLSGGVLGEVVGKPILIARDAAGYGWFVDSTPAGDLEFANLLGPHTLAARNGSPAANRVDLLTAVMHEMGQMLGYQDTGSLDLMYPTLPLGERRLLAGSPVPFMALAAKGLGNSFSTNGGIRDQLLASSNDDGSRKWSWL
jgi:hypothetical protein